MRALVCEYILDADKGEWAMRTVVTRMPAADLAEELAAMRRWLDKNAIEPLKFRVSGTKTLWPSVQSSIKKLRPRRSGHVSTIRNGGGHTMSCY
jgi:hypothetical protein